MFMDNKYILMCQESTEIQELWKPKIGDKCFDIDDLNGLGVELVGEEDVFCNSQKDYWEGYIWLPRQEDLQEILLDKRGDGAGDIINDFYSFIVDNEPLPYVSNREAISMFWLVFIMATLYQKKWDSESKTWVSL